MAEIDIRFDVGKTVGRLGLEAGGAAQTALDTIIVKDCAKYCPKDTGMLAESAISSIGTGMIEYAVPYAHYLYYGETYGPNIPIVIEGELQGFFSPFGITKQKTGEMLTYSTKKNALAGPFWFERAKTDRKDAWISEVKRVVGNSG